jgi:hypothetical protein
VITGTLAKIWDANQSLWNLINTQQVKIAIDNFRETALALEGEKSILKDRILNGDISDAELVEDIDSIESRLRDFQKVIRGFASAIDDAAPSASLGDELRGAASGFANAKYLDLDSVKSVWRKTGPSAAATQLQSAITDTGNIVRALDCLQDTITRGGKPANCDFRSESHSSSHS